MRSRTSSTDGPTLFDPPMTKLCVTYHTDLHYAAYAVGLDHSEILKRNLKFCKFGWIQENRIELGKPWSIRIRIVSQLLLDPTRFIDDLRNDATAKHSVETLKQALLVQSELMRPDAALCPHK